MFYTLHYCTCTYTSTLLYCNTIVFNTLHLTLHYYTSILYCYTIYTTVPYSTLLYYNTIVLYTLNCAIMATIVMANGKFSMAIKGIQLKSMKKLTW